MILTPEQITQPLIGFQTNDADGLEDYVLMTQAAYDALTAHLTRSGEIDDVLSAATSRYSEYADEEDYPEAEYGPRRDDIWVFRDLQQLIDFGRDSVPAGTKIRDLGTVWVT